MHALRPTIRVRVLDWLKSCSVRLRSVVMRLIRSVSKRNRGADILGAPLGAATADRATARWAPSRPAKFSPASVSDPSVFALARKAALFLFDECGLGVVPAQFWPFLRESGDPGEALSQFLLGLGCDPALVAQGNTAEREKARD